MAKPRRAREDEKSVCVFSEDERYRYSLYHVFDPLQPSYVPVKVAMWVMTNPSVANQTQLDPTLRRCKAFSRSWGYDAMLVCNAFALVSTDPKRLFTTPDPIGPLNDDTIERAARREDVGIIVAGWGTPTVTLGRAPRLIELLGERLTALKVNKDGSPGHPLYIKGSTIPQPYPPRATPAPLSSPPLPDAFEPTPEPSTEDSTSHHS